MALSLAVHHGISDMTRMKELQIAIKIVHKRAIRLLDFLAALQVVHLEVLASRVLVPASAKAKKV